MSGDAGLTLFVSGASALSAEAIVNARRLCDEHLDQQQLKVVDLNEDPGAAHDAGVVVTPTLLMHGAGPARRISGSLADTGKVLSALGLG